MDQPLLVLVAGGWHLGSVVAAAISQAGHNVSIWDPSPSVQKSWGKGTPPLFEPGLEEIVRKNWGKTLHWCEAPCPPWDWIIIAFDSLLDEGDQVDISSIEKNFLKIVERGISTHTRFLFTSQLPVGTSRRFRASIERMSPTWKGTVLYQPENLRLGQALQSFYSPDRIVLGLDKGEPIGILVKEYRKLTGVSAEIPIDTMSLESAEMVKHALNAFLATCIVFANQISDLSEQTNANAWDVMRNLKRDSRVGEKAFLYPGLGFSGGTLGRDIRVLGNLEVPKTQPSKTTFFNQIYEHNEKRNEWLITSLSQCFDQRWKDRKVLLLGVVYKPNTSTVRRSPAIELAKMLSERGATCIALDPKADLFELSDDERANLKFTLESDFASAFQGADAAILITEWPEFLKLPWMELSTIMRKPLVFDTKNYLERLDLHRSFHRVVPGVPE